MLATTTASEPSRTAWAVGAQTRTSSRVVGRRNSTAISSSSHTTKNSVVAIAQGRIFDGGARPSNIR